MDTTSNLNLPFIAAAQAQKHVTHNESLRALVRRGLSEDGYVVDALPDGRDCDEYLGAAGYDALTGAAVVLLGCGIAWMLTGNLIMFKMVNFKI